MRKFLFPAVFVCVLYFSSCLCRADTDFLLLDLTSYFNNNGAATEENPSEGNFDYGGFSYAFELLPKPGKVSVKEIPFIFPQTSQEGNNIACHSQVIKIQPDRYRAILLLGSSTNGDYEACLWVQFSDGSRSCLKTGLTDWCRDSVFGEIPAFSFPYRIGPEGRQEIQNYIWLQVLRIKEEKFLSAIILPENKNIHIFAITLASRELPSLSKAGMQTDINAKELTIHLVGHAHIDMNWLWLWPETVRVCRDTFSDMLKKMEQYPDFKFSQSQPSTYIAMEEKHPEIFSGIQEYVKKGQWEITGATWVEGDMNMASGEAIVRQILYANRYFREKFGKFTQVCWEPDTFGHAWTVPQILKKSGIKYYYFCRCGKGKPVFWWESPDGSRVLAYSWRWYNEQINRAIIRDAVQACRSTGLRDWLIVYGTGDHGGGPRKEDIEEALRLNSEPDMPDIKFSTAGDFFKAVENQKEFPVIRDELNFTFEGCYTTHADIKKYNRTLENLLPQAEIFSAIAMLYGSDYPQGAFVDAWRKTCFNQFHDIFDGSAIHGSYAYSKRLFNTAYEAATLALENSLKAICSKIDISKSVPPAAKGKAIPVVVFNPLSWERDDIVEVKIPFQSRPSSVAIFDAENEIPSRVTGFEEQEGKYYIKIIFTARNVPSLGYKVFYALPLEKTGKAGKTDLPCSTTKLENQFYKIRLDRTSGCITGIYDKENKIELVPPDQKANVFQLLFEKPHGMSAWNIGQISRVEDLDSNCTIALIETGPVRARIQICHRSGKSTFYQDIVLYDGLRRIDFPCRIDWQEQGTKFMDGPMLKVAFPLNIRDGKARFEIPFGSIERKANGREYPTQKWMDLSGTAESGIDYGVALLNDCKYGCDIKDNVMRLTLLRSSYEPDPRPDRGIQEFTYALFPHKGSWDAKVVRAGYELNNPLVGSGLDISHILPTSPPASHKSPGTTHSFLEISPESLILTALKKAEDSQDIILRFYECEGKDTTAEIKFGFPVREVKETDLMENNLSSVPVQDGKITLKVGKYEIKTLKLKL